MVTFLGESYTLLEVAGFVLTVLLGLGTFWYWLSGRLSKAREHRKEDQSVNIALTHDYVTFCIDETSKPFKQLVIKNSDPGPVIEIELTINGVDFAKHGAFHVDDGPDMELLKYGIPSGGRLSFSFGIPEMGEPDVSYAHAFWKRADGTRVGHKVDLYDCRTV